MFSVYKVGLLADIHYNDTDLDGKISHSVDPADPEHDLEHALKYFKNKGVDFIGCAGDITTNDTQHLYAFYNKLNGLLPEIEVYACKGNHDNAVEYNFVKYGLENYTGTTLRYNNGWLDYSIPSKPKFEIHFFENSDSDNSSFYFEHPTGDIFVFFNVNYGGSGTNGIGSFPNTQYYTWGDILELQSILDKYRNNRVFIFTHLFFPNKAGNPGNEYTNPNNHDYHYVLSGKLFAILNELNNYYKNSIWISGHSHYYWKCEEAKNYRYCAAFGENTYSGTDRANVCNWDLLNDDYNYNDKTALLQQVPLNKEGNAYIESAYNIHVPSCARPVRLCRETGNYYDWENGGSEGGMLEIREDKVVLNEISFSEHNPYILGETTEIPLNTCNFNAFSKSQNLPEINISGDYVEFTFTEDSLKIAIIDFDIPKNIEILDSQVLDKDGNDITSLFIDLTGDYAKFGFYSGDSWMRYQINGTVACRYSTTYNGLELGTSSTFSNTYPNMYPLTLRTKAVVLDYDPYNIVYVDKIYKKVNIPLANYPKLTIESKEYLYFENYIEKFNK